MQLAEMLGLIGGALVGQCAPAVIEYLLDQFGVEVQVVGIEDFFDRIACPVGIDKPGMHPGDIDGERGQLGDAEPVRIAHMAVEPLVRRLHVEGRVSIPDESIARQPSKRPDERKRVPILARDHSENALTVAGSVIKLALPCNVSSPIRIVICEFTYRLRGH